MTFRLRLLPPLLAVLLAVPAARAELKLTLDEAIRLALEKNPQIKVDAYNRPIARADWLAELGRFDPALTFRRSYSESNTPSYGPATLSDLYQSDEYSLGLEGTTPWGLSYRIGGTASNERRAIDPDAFATFGGIQVTQPLLRGFGFGANLRGVRIARANRGISDWTFRQSAIDTITAVIGAYSDVSYAQNLLRITRRSRELSSGLVAENERRFKVGSMSENDVVQARARSAARDQAILYAEQAVRDSVNRLRQLIGETEFPIEPENIEVEPPEISDQSSVSLQDDLKIAFEKRPDYQAARLGVDIYRANHVYARNQLLPQLDFVGSYGYRGLDTDFGVSRRMVRDRENRAYSAGVVVSVPLTFTEGRGRLRSARLKLRQSEADLDRLEQDIAVAVASAAGQIDTARRRVAANRAAYELAKQALDDELKKLRAGTSSTFFVLNLQEQLAAVESNLYQSLADQRRAHANYDRALGRTLDVHHVTLAKE